MQKEEIKFADSTVFEGMTSIRAILKGNDLSVNNRRIRKIMFSKKRYKSIFKEVGYLKAISEKGGFTVEESDDEQINKLTLGNTHGGIIAVAESRSFPALTSTDQIRSNGFYAMIEGIEDPYNFGYSLRSLYAMGCDGIILCERNWMSAAGVVARSSAGASEMFDIMTADPIAATELFKQKGYRIVCADERTDKILGECDLSLPILLIVGGERRGISSSLIDHADLLVKIDYGREFRASLSAASATTMFAYEIHRQNSK